MKWERTWTDDVARLFIDDLVKANSFADAIATVEKDWKPIAPDALQLLQNAAEEEWAEFKAGLDSERSKVFAGQAWADKWADVLIPDVMVCLFKVIPESSAMPTRVAIDRVTELGYLEEANGVYVLGDVS